MILLIKAITEQAEIHKKENKMQVAELKSYLKKHKITYEELAQKTGLSISTIKKVFAGISQYPRLDTMQAIEEALGLNKPLEWTDEDKAAGVGRHPIYLSEDETEWLELRSEVIRTQGVDYLKTLIAMIEAVIKQKK